MRKWAKSVLFFFIPFVCSLALAQDDVFQALNKPIEPFHIIGNIYYVGAADITSFLIVTPKGHILLDGGFIGTAPLIQRNIEGLGFRMQDVRILLNSHASFDHAGGLAQLKQFSGAQMLASPGDVPILESGGQKDPQRAGIEFRFPPVHVDRLVHDGEKITLGDSMLQAVLTPGLTPGCTTWTMQVKEGGKTYHVVFVCSLTVPPEYQLINNTEYPEIANDYRKSIAKLRALPCDVFLAPHGSFFNLHNKIDGILKVGPSQNVFVKPWEYKEYIDRSERALNEKLASERKALRSAGAPTVK